MDVVGYALANGVKASSSYKSEDWNLGTLNFLKIDGDLMLYDDFFKGLSKWCVYCATTTLYANQVKITGSATNGGIYSIIRFKGDGFIEARIKTVSGEIWVEMIDFDTRRNIRGGFSGGNVYLQGLGINISRTYSYSTGTYYTVKIEKIGNNINLYINGILQLSGYTTLNLSEWVINLYGYASGSFEVWFSNVYVKGNAINNQKVLLKNYIDAVVYYDGRYPTGWVSVNSAIAICDYLSSRGFIVKNADELKIWMTNHINKGTASAAVCVMAMDIVPDTITETQNTDCTFRKFLNAGGRIVWIGDWQLYYQGKSDGTKVSWGSSGSTNILGFTAQSNGDTSNCSISSFGSARGLKNSWKSQRAMQSGITPHVVLATSTGGYPCAYIYYFDSTASVGGFVRLHDVGIDYATYSYYIQEIYDVALSGIVSNLYYTSGSYLSPVYDIENLDLVTNSFVSWSSKNIIYNPASFTRSSNAYKSDGTLVIANIPRYESGKFGKAVMIEEGTTNASSAFNYGNFDNGTVGNSITPSSVGYSGNVNSYTVVYDYGYSGLGAKVTLSTKSSGQAYIQFTAEAITSASVSWSFQFKYKILSGADKLYDETCLQCYNSSGTHLGNIGTRVEEDIGNGWKLVKILGGVTLANTYYIRGQVRLGCVANSTIVYLVDDIQIEQKPYCTSYFGGTRSAESLTIPTSGILNLQEGEIGCWVYIDDRFKNRMNGKYAWIWGTKGSPYYPILNLYRSSSNLLRFVSRNASNNESYIEKPLSEISLGWHYLVCTWKSSRLAFYIDGQLIGAVSNPYLPNAVDNQMYIGHNPSVGEQCNILIDDFYILSKARSDEEIAATYQSGKPFMVVGYTTCKLSFDSSLQADAGGVNVFSNVSYDGGNTWQGWKLCTNGGSIPDLKPNSKLQLKAEFTTPDATQSPELYNLAFGYGGIKGLKTLKSYLAIK